MTSAQEARADGWQRDTAKLLATVRALARENRELRARLAEFEAAQAARERIQPLVRALVNLYDVVWNKTATLESDFPGHNLISYDDTNAIDEAGSAVEELLASGAVADLLGGES